MEPATTTPQDDALYHKIAWRLVPFLFICYVVNYIDRVNIGFAKLQFLQDLNLDEIVFGLAAGLFFIGYLAFGVPSNLLLARIGVRKTLLRIMGLWGVVTVLLMFVRGATELYILRFLLGAAEAGFFPGIILYLTYWFPDQRRARITSLFIMAVPIAGIVGGPLSGGIMTHFHEALGLRGWQWLFLLEGLPAIALGVAALLYLDDGPRSSHWLNTAEKDRVQAALDADRKRRSAHQVPAAGLAQVLRNPRIYTLSAIYFTIFMGLNAMGFWVPTLLRQVGVQQISEIGWIAGGISALTAIGLYLVPRSSDRHMERRWHVAGCGLLTAGCFVLLRFASHSVALTALLLVVASICIYSTLTIFWTIPQSYLDGGAVAGGIAVISSLGAIGGAVSPTLLGALKTRTGSLYDGLTAIAVVLALGMLLLLLTVPAHRRAAESAAAS